MNIAALLVVKFLGDFEEVCVIIFPRVPKYIRNPFSS